MHSPAPAPSPQRPSDMPRVSVVIPTYNEAKNMPHVLAALPEDVHEVVVVDGGSQDGTVDVVRSVRPDARVVLQTRRGKGNAVACGFASVTGDIVVMLDADGSADPGEIRGLVDALMAGADFATGSRFIPGGGRNDLTRTRAWGNRGLNLVANLLFGTRCTDLCYGHSAFWTDCLPILRLDAGDHRAAAKLWGDGFEIETIIKTRIAKAGLTITEVPSVESTRRIGQSHLRTWWDGGRVLQALIVERLDGRGRLRRAQLAVYGEPAAWVPLRQDGAARRRVAALFDRSAVVEVDSFPAAPVLPRSA